MTSKCGFSSEYIDSIPEYERNMYLSYYKEELKQSQELQQNTGSEVNNSRYGALGNAPELGL